MTTFDQRHLDPELIQSFLDGAASSEEAARVQGHTASCARCRSEMEAWESLFHGLGQLEEVFPSSDFGGRVMAQLPVATNRPGLAARVKASLRRGPAFVEPGGHVVVDHLQDLLEGLLPEREAMAVEGHLNTCRRCRDEVAGLRRVFAAFEKLPHYAPSAEFSERVMAHVRVQLALETARPTLRERLQLLARSVSPETRKRVAALAGAALTPAVTLGLVAYTVFSHPMVTFGNLFAFLELRGSELVAGWGGALANRVMGSNTVLRTYSLLESLMRSPTSAALAVTGLCALSLVAAWVLYRNVIATQSLEGQYAG